MDLVKTGAGTKIGLRARAYAGLATARLGPWRPLLLALVAFCLPLLGLAFAPGRLRADRWERVEGLPALGPVRQIVAAQATVYAVVERWGVFRSEDSGVTWRPASPLPQGRLGQLEAEPLALDPDDSADLLLGLAAPPAIYRTRDGGRSWIRRRGLDTQGFEALAAGPGSVVYAVGRGHLYLSGDGGDTWLEAASFPIRSAVLAAAVDRAGGALLLGTRGDGLWLTDDHGQSWSVALPGCSVFSIATAEGGRVYAGAQDGVYCSVDGGFSWRRMPLAGSPALALAAPAGAPGRLFVALAGSQVAYSADGGETWLRLRPLPAAAQVTALAADPRSAGRLLVGTERGLWRCTLAAESGP